MLPSHLQGLESALAVGLIVLTIKAGKRLSFHFEKSYFYFLHLSRARTFRDPLFSSRMKGVLISLPVECAAVSTGPLPTPAATAHIQYIFYNSLCVADIPKKC